MHFCSQGHISVLFISSGARINKSECLPVQKLFTEITPTYIFSLSFPVGSTSRSTCSVSKMQFLPPRMFEFPKHVLVWAGKYACFLVANLLKLKLFVLQKFKPIYNNSETFQMCSVIIYRKIGHSTGVPVEDNDGKSNHRNGSCRTTTQKRFCMASVQRPTSLFLYSVNSKIPLFCL